MNSYLVLENVLFVLWAYRNLLTMRFSHWLLTASGFHPDFYSPSRRFYFVGDEDLLEIIGNGKNLIRLQKHFKKMFAGVSYIIVDDDNSQVTGIGSKEGEEVVFSAPVLLKVCVCVPLTSPPSFTSAIRSCHPRCFTS